MGDRPATGSDFHHVDGGNPQRQAAVLMTLLRLPALLEFLDVTADGGLVPFLLGDAFIKLNGFFDLTVIFQ